jgi:hypothetical protein
MDKERNVVRGEIEQTREQLTEQLAELALRLEHAQEVARNAVRPRYYVEKKPWLVFAGAVAAGYMLTRRRSDRRWRDRLLEARADVEPPRPAVVPSSAVELGGAIEPLRAEVREAVGGLARQVEKLERKLDDARLHSSPPPVPLSNRLEATTSDEREPRESVRKASARHVTALLRELEPYTEVAKGTLYGLGKALLLQLGREMAEKALARSRFAGDGGAAGNGSDVEVDEAEFEEYPPPSGDRPWMR